MLKDLATLPHPAALLVQSEYRISNKPRRMSIKRDAQ